MVNVYIAADTGPSGFGIASKALIRELVDRKDVNLTVKTHFWGWNRKGFQIGNRKFTDTRFREYLMRNDYVNEDYLIEDPRDMADRRDVNLTQNMDSNTTVDPQECMIRQFEGKEDVWLAIGGPGFAEQAPQDDDIYTIVSTDFNLDIVPRKWEHYLDQVDEMWVPAKWVKKAIENRFGDTRPELVDKVKVFRYGVPMDYEPTDYDCEACPNQHQNLPATRAAGNATCLKDDKFNFLVISRFYHIKGVYRTIKAFVEEFRGDEPVRLFFKTTSNQQFQFNPVQSVQSVINELGYPDPPEIGMKVEPFDEQHLYDLMGHCDAFIQASRAECFGIAQFQAAYCGTPVIATDWAAQAELIPDDNEGFLKLKDYTVERPKPETQAFMFAGSDDYPPDSHWATPSIEELGDKMRQLYEMSQEERDRRGQQAREFVEQQFQWSEQVKPRVERLKKVGMR